MRKEKNILTLKTITKSNVWKLQENDITNMIEAAKKDTDFKENKNHYISIIKSAFEIEEYPAEPATIAKKYKERGFKTSVIKLDENTTLNLAIKKRPITRITDLTYENIRHISAAKLLEVIGNNFGGGWDSISQSIKDIIESGFDVSTTTLPATRLRKPGGMYEKKVADGFEVLEIPKGSWTEAIFVKAKPEPTTKHVPIFSDDLDNEKDIDLDNEDEDAELPEDEYEKENDDEFDVDLEVESYRTTFDEDPSELSLDDVVNEEDEDY